MNQHQIFRLVSPLGLSLLFTTVGGAIASSVSAATLSGVRWNGTTTSLTWDENNAVSAGTIISGNPTTFPAGFSSLVDNSQTVGELLGGETSLELAESGSIGIVELNWGDRRLANQSGNDLVIYENGHANEPEAFALAIRKVGETSFSEYLYQFTDHFSEAYDVFATVFDLSLFGLAEGEMIDAIRIRNLSPNDLVSDEKGQGFLGGTYTPTTRSGGATFDPNGKLDADITYVVGLHNLLAPPTPPASKVPEPSTLLGLLGLGIMGCLTRWHRRQS